jgi:putative membrane protein
MLYRWEQNLDKTRVTTMYNGQWMGFGGGFMWIVWILLIVGVVWVIKVMLSTGNDAPPRANLPQSALDILKARFARGEISAEEYKRMRQELEQ